MRAVEACVVLVAATGLSRGARAQFDEPLLTKDGLVYPEGSAIPRGLTPIERKWIEDNPLAAPRAVTPPPMFLSDVHCPGEYEPMQGLLFAWEPSSGGITTILTTMVREVTTTGNATAFIMVDTIAERDSVSMTLSTAGANMARVKFHVVTTDTIWIRDYGPRYIYEGDVRSIVDHTYNRPRPNDNLLPTFWSGQTKQTRYEIPLVHGGGNFHLSSLGPAWSTRLIANENPSLTEAQIINHWLNYQNVSVTLTNPFPTSVDSTQHIDMWMQIIGDMSVVISDWPNNAGSTQDVICDSTAAAMASAGWTVTRVPAFSVSGVHYTFTNVVMCNNLVLLPSYTNTTVQPHNATALSRFQDALPGKTIVQVNCQAIVSLAGVMHCIVMHVPAPKGGTSPTAYLRSLRGPQTLEPGSQVDILWSTDDDEAVANVDILLSTDGGATFPTLIAGATPDDGQFTWTVPSIHAPNARIRIVARDALGNTGHDSSRADLFINAPPPVCAGDADGNGVVDFGDVTSVLVNYGQVGEPHGPGDADGSGVVNFADVTTVLATWGNECQ